jgi:hypothetical protein
MILSISIFIKNFKCRIISFYLPSPLIRCSLFWWVTVTILSLNCEQLLPLLYFIQYTNICTSFSGRLFDLSITDPKTISFAVNKLWRINSLSFTVVKGREWIVCLLQNDAVHGKGWVHCCVFNRVWSQQSQLVQLLLLDHGRRTKNVDCSLEMSSGFYSKYPVFIGCTNIWGPQPFGWDHCLRYCYISSFILG